MGKLNKRKDIIKDTQYNNGSNSLQLFVVDFDTVLVWELLLLPRHL